MKDPASTIHHFLALAGISKTPENISVSGVFHALQYAGIRCIVHCIFGTNLGSVVTIS